jgi:hypothetical protein
MRRNVEFRSDNDSFLSEVIIPYTITRLKQSSLNRLIPKNGLNGMAKTNKEFEKTIDVASTGKRNEFGLQTNTIFPMNLNT